VKVNLLQPLPVHFPFRFRKPAEGLCDFSLTQAVRPLDQSSAGCRQSSGVGGMPAWTSNLVAWMPERAHF